MSILVLADLHLDLWSEAGRDPLTALSAEDWAQFEAVIIAGDLTNKPKIRWKYAIRRLAQHIEAHRIHIIPGNHDYYDHALDGDDRLAGIAADQGAQFAQKRVLVFGGVRFLCCTLWTDFELHGQPLAAQAKAADRMNDYRYIRLAQGGYRKARPSDTAARHADQRRWLSAQLSMPFAGDTVVVTHHCPHPDLLAPGMGDLGAAYGSDLSTLIDQHQPAAWLFGHTHHHAEIRHGATWLRNISLGYARQCLPSLVPDILMQGKVTVEHGRFAFANQPR
ncbi:metallophosphoesterase [Roseinatronobacter sp. NSM]|uniref:metallophosphoesterase n=1 Tax=Roseinatronobacter sp. NSM TaxID=3457785 RepID=UPI004035E69A